MSDTPAPAWVALIGQVIARRDDKDYAGQRSALRRGLRPHGQDYATPVVAPFSRGDNLAALTRAAALPAVHTAPHRSGVSFGRAMSELTKRRTGDWPASDPAKRDNIGRRVVLLPRLPMESAVKEMSTLLAFASSEGISIDYYDLARTILNWGDGLDDESKAVRSSVMVDYYTPIRK